MADEIDQEIDGLVAEFKKHGIDLIGGLKGTEFSEEQVRYFLRLLRDKELFKKTYGVTFDEHFLVSEGLTLEEARYVLDNPCLEDAQNRCSYYKEEGECVPFGCNLLNGWLFYKIGPDEKLKPNYSAWTKLPRDTLYIDAEKAIEEGTLEKQIENFLNEPEY